MRFFLGGVPFGCNNIGDEAILAGVVKILRRNFKDCQITVSTGKPQETADLLHVEAVPLYGFKQKYPLSGLRPHLKQCDAFIWSGATGLSDYPRMAISILKESQQLGLKTVIWAVGMDSKLNPAFFKLSGKKLFLAKVLKALAFNKINFINIIEAKIIRRMKNNIASTLSNCGLIICRDPESRQALMDCSSKLPIVVGADSALIFNEANLNDISHLDSNIRNNLMGDYEKIGLCISAQRQVSNTELLIHSMDKLLEPSNRRMFFIPMNPQTDFLLMKELQNRLKNKERSFLIENCEQPKHVLAIASKCSVVISSRLHLLILAANMGTPIVGISRGSKIDNFLSQFELKSTGSVYDCDFDLLIQQTESLISNPLPFKQKRDLVYKSLYERLSKVETLLTEYINR